MTILSKLGPDYSVFVLNFYSTKLTAQTWKMPKLFEFMESLTHEQDKLVMMGTINPSKDQDLVAVDSKVDSKRKKKTKKTPEQKRDKAKSQEESSGSKKNPQKKNNKGEICKCA